jgi:cysteinyl-tRNA synthetase
LLQQSPNDFLQSDKTGDASQDWIDEAIQARLDARAQKNWAQADTIRDSLLEKGIVLEDTAGGTTWRKI